MMRFSTLLKHPADWMTGEAEGNSVVLTSRVRLARNLRREPFPGWATKERRVSVLERVKPEVESLPEMKDGFSVELDGLSSLQKQVLVERPSRRQSGQMAGRTSCNRWVNFDGSESMRGHIVPVQITEAMPNSLRGRVLTSELSAA